MEDIIGPFDGLPNGNEIGNIPFEKRAAPLATGSHDGFAQVCSTPGTQIVQHAHLGASLEQRCHQV
jgi:hypothetical protein